jgi:hypothetical protein
MPKAESVLGCTDSHEHSARHGTAQCTPCCAMTGR